MMNRQQGDQDEMGIHWRNPLPTSRRPTQPLLVNAKGSILFELSDACCAVQIVGATMENSSSAAAILLAAIVAVALLVLLRKFLFLLVRRFITYILRPVVRVFAP